MVSPSSLAGRAALAVLLMIGFYLLAIGIAAGLLYIPYAEWKYADRISGRLAISCIIGALIILWSILPRFDRFVAPGPLLTQEKHPKLFDVISGVAKATDQEMPAEVYLVADMNAWVSNRGGIMGFGSRRVMGIGLPLLQALGVSHLRGVIAHEFGHFYGGDTRLGPWVYKTRASIGRTVTALGEQGSLLQIPFVAYGKAFLRITHAVSRQQEYSADALAARIVGAPAMAEGLKRVHGAGMAFDAFWRNEVIPVLSSGFRPPMAQGFSHFLAAPRVATAVTSSLDEQVKAGKADPYDTHPSLRERLDALQQAGGGPAAGDDSPAVSLLGGDVDALEAALLTAMAGDEAAQKLQSVAWDQVGERVFVPAWAKHARKHNAFLAGMTPGSLPDSVKDLDAQIQRTVKSYFDDVPADERKPYAVSVIGAALAAALSRKGWKATTLPGDDPELACGASRVKPFEVVPKLQSCELTAEAWQQLCSETGIAAEDLRVPGTT